MSRPTLRKEAEQTVPGAAEIDRLYKEAAFEETPSTELDEAVLRGARRQLAPRRFARRWAPLAVAASVLLSLAVVMRLGPRPDFTGAPATEGSAVNPSALRNSASPSPSSGTDNGSSARTAADAEALRFALPSTDGAAPPRAVAEHAAEASPAAAEAARLSSDLTRSTCPDTDSPEQWARCILQLRERGASEQVEQQTRLLMERHPGYRLPETLAPGSPAESR